MKATHRGVSFEYGDAFLIIPALTVDQARELAGEMDTAQAPLLIPEDLQDTQAFREFKEGNRKRLDAMTKVIATAVRRNYPAMTDAAIREFITLDIVGLAFNAAAGVSQAPKVRCPEELAAVGPTSPGASSTAA